uniref:Disintegrin and metalloproteinase domain-containing protein 10-like isoform X3 n=1 Tax=Diabrotica virgifera virgifera TaxID=50390 RepID=A0A6P7G5I4_DIAVI
MGSFKFTYILILFFTLCYCEWKFDIKDYINLKLSKHFVISTNIAIQNYSQMLTDQLKHGLHFHIHLNTEEDLQIYIKTKPERLSKKTKFIIIENDENTTTLTHPNKLVEGFITKEKYGSYVIGYLEDFYFYGKIVMTDKVFYIENLKKYIDIFPEYFNTSYNAIAFERDFLSSESKNKFKETYYLKPQDVDHSYRTISKRMAVRGKLCSLLVLIDYSFLSIVHHFNTDSAVNQVLMAVEEANSLFRSTDFDENGYPDNIGFYVKYCIVEKTRRSNLLPPYSGTPMEAKLFVKMFSQNNLLPNVCLGVAFTGQSFKNNILGISYSPVPAKIMALGGICGLYLNTLAVSARSSGRNILQFIFNLSLCHELGHSFGADHDSTKKCEGYLMSPQTPPDQDRKHFIFSPCSKRDMLITMRHKGQCFEDDHDAFCGNKIKEETEECDCGPVRDCWEFDKCCIPHGRRNACKINRDYGYKCHPSQGLCCTSQCQYANLESYGLHLFYLIFD